MKYMLLLLGRQESWDAMGLGAREEPVWAEEDVDMVFRFMSAVTRDLSESGELVDTRGLADPAHTRTVRLRNGVPAVTDGPFSEAREVLAGYLVVDCASLERATEIAARIASCPVPAGYDPDPVEVRPIMEDAGTEM
ncbi:YciI family protein [Streptomyces sp. NPDC004647]|uniref:YciI family protein n=1 Tax=Streptomyces sp. NPDC004647 TaxID=3154671 RepID=UPI0033BD7424